MTWLFVILFSALMLYGLLFLWMIIGFLATRNFLASNNSFQPVSIIISARNEEKNIAYCLDSIVKQDYPASLIELILVNDASTDATGLKAQAILRNSNFDYRIIFNAQKLGKKKSLQQAINLAKNNLIITRDADTFTLSNNWLKTISAFQQANHLDFIIAPVAIANNFGILWALQTIENNILALVNCGTAYYQKPFLCNGANLAFTKSIFQKTKAYASHINIPSGDDVLFLEDVKKIPGAKIAYLKSKEAIVHTFPCYSFKELINQKIRWAGKFKVNKNPLNWSLAVLSLVVNMAWVFCLVYGYVQPINNAATLKFVLLKVGIDILLLFLTMPYIKNKNLIWFALPVSCIYPLYACVIGFSSLFYKPVWK